MCAPLIEGCSDCNEALTAEALALIDQPDRYTADEIAEAFNDTRLMGYEYAEHVGGKDLVLRIFTRLATEEFPKSQFLVVPWIVVGDVGSDPRFLDAIKDMGLFSYWNETEAPDYCRKDDGGTYVCGARRQSTQ